MYYYSAVNCLSLIHQLRSMKGVQPKSDQVDLPTKSGYDRNPVIGLLEVRGAPGPGLIGCPPNSNIYALISWCFSSRSFRQSVWPSRCASILGVP